ncbi:type II CAAX endopeptidase family protein [uncultured Paludibaculum sp.]|uniref:CPBP family intramembrane glutamic endopeptidase n=1 Tax=uncultured Paludibaculum sp. TaxID=1765020 RepID=UPI002AAB01D6|nr:type II CAAX endopeptidase family protein [uncultured Paludibaculum sp.]
MTQPQTMPPDEAPRPSQPFWSWIDAALVFTLAVPCLFLSALLSKGLFALASSPPSDAAKAITLQFVAYVLWFGVLILLLKIRYDEPFWPSLGWRVPWPGMGPTLFAGPFLVFAVAILGQLLHTPVIDNSIEKMLHGRMSILLVGFFASTLGPLAEELIFRGFLQPLMIRTFGIAAGILFSSLPFALLHGPQYSWSWQHIVLLVLASSVFGFTRHRTGSTAASTLVHATYNLTFFAGFLLQRKELFS